MNLGTFSVRLVNCLHGLNGSVQFPVGLLKCVHRPNESGHISCWATQLCAWTQWIWTNFLLGYSSVCRPNESGHIACWATQLCAWTQWIWTHFLLRYSPVCRPNESGHISCRATQLCSWTQWIWAHFLLGYSNVCIDQMNLGTFPVGLLNCVHGPNESGHISCWATQMCAWTKWIWTHFLLGYSNVCIDQMNLGTFPVGLLNCVHGPNESGHIFCWATQMCA